MKLAIGILLILGIAAVSASNDFEYSPDLDYSAMTLGYSPKSCNITRFVVAFLLAPGGVGGSKLYKMHGLWPDQCAQCPSCGYPTYCKPVKFNLTALEPIQDKLKQDWFHDPELLRHEWLKHGSCTIWTELEYFRNALMWYDTALDLAKKQCCHRRCLQQCFIYVCIMNTNS